MNRKIVFDSYAILALIENEDGSQTVADILADKETAIFLSVINFGEIYYIIHRRNGEQAAEEVIQSILLEESLTIVEMPWEGEGFLMQTLSHFLWRKNFKRRWLPGILKYEALHSRWVQK
jgi:predicted nucleic acid-binding protein